MGSPVPVGRGRRRELEAPCPDPAERLLAPERTRLGKERSGREKTVPEDRQEEQLDTFRDDVRAPVQQRPRTRGALEREAAAHGRDDGDAFHMSRRAYELDDPAQDQLVDIDLLDCAL